MTELLTGIPAGVILALAVVVWIVASARITRLLTQDSFPPVVWLRMKWDDKTEGNGWNVLFHCHWCMSFWVTAAIGVWGFLSNLHWTWWILNVVLAASYISAFVVERDEVE
jgi:hypothetical protein